MPTNPSSRTATQKPAWPEDVVEVGRVLGAWGVKGWIKVQSFVSDSQSLVSATRWLVRPPGKEGGLQHQTAPGGFPDHLEIVEAREHGGMVIAQVQGVADRTQAEALHGAQLLLSRASFPAARAGEYYWVDLIGLSVVNRQGEAMGQVIGLLDTGPHSVLRLAKPEGDDGTERLIPFVAAYVDDVDLVKQRITVDWGLDY